MTKELSQRIDRIETKVDEDRTANAREHGELEGKIDALAGHVNQIHAANTEAAITRGKIIEAISRIEAKLEGGKSASATSLTGRLTPKGIVITIGGTFAVVIAVIAVGNAVARSATEETTSLIVQILAAIF